MNKDIIEQLNESGSKTFEALKDLATINTKLAEKLTSQQLELMSVYMEAGVKEMNLVSTSKGYKDLLAGQAALATELNEKALAYARNLTSLFSEAKDEISAWVEKGIEAGVTPVVKAARKAA